MLLSMKKLAKHVQQTIGTDPLYAKPGYQWCLMHVETHHDAAYAATPEGPGRVDLVKAKLVELIKPHARRAG